MSGWQLQDQQGTITTYTIPQNIKILSDGFLVFKRPDTKIMLNNDSDGLNLLTPGKKTADSMVFASAPLSQSYNKTDSGWQWSSVLTPGSINIISVAEAKSNDKALSKTKNSVKNNNVEAGLADLSQTINTNQDDNNAINPWFLFFIALAITIILASTVLVLKLRFQKNVRT